MQLKTATSIVFVATLMSLRVQAAPVAQQDTNALTIATPPTQSLIAPMPDIKHYKNPQSWDWNEADHNIQDDPNATDYTPENEENAKWGGSSFWNPWGCGGWNSWNWTPWWNTWNWWC